MRIFTVRRLCLLLCLLPLLLLPPAASADRAYQTIGADVQRAEVIALADAERAGPDGYDTRLTFREILKGDPALVGQTDTLGLRTLSSESVRVVPNSQGVLVFLDGDWRLPDHDAVIEAYTESADISLVRTLISIYALPDEAKRINALSSHLGEKDPRWHEELFWALGEMRDPANYPLLTGLYPSLAPTEQRQLVKLIGEIGDPRGLPVVFQAARADNYGLRAESLRVMTFQFPGAPGVAEAMRGLLKDPKLVPSAASYLLRDTPNDAELKRLAGPPFVERPRLAVAEDAGESGYSRRAAATALLPKADPALKSRLRRSLLLLLTRDVSQGDWLEAEEAARLLRAFHHTDCLPALLNGLTRPREPYLPDEAWRTAVLAIHDLGPAARTQAADLLVDKIREQGPGRDQPLSLDLDHDNQNFLALAWLGGRADYQEAAQVMDPRFHQMWETYLPLSGIAQARSEADFLLPFLLHPPTWPENAQTMVMTRLGELHEKRAVQPLFESLRANPWYGDYAAQDALIALGGPEVELGALRLIARADAGDARRQAGTILEAHPSSALLPLLRKMIRSPAPDVRGEALYALGRWGTPADLEALVPLADFWTGDRSCHASAMQAVADIRSRQAEAVTRRSLQKSP